MPVYQKLLKLQSTAKALAPNAEGQTGAARYPYVSGAKLLSVIRPSMDELGLILKTEVIGIDNNQITYNTSKGEKTEVLTSLKLRFTWVDTEDGSQDVNEFAGNGMNAFDKGLGSALTYGERYFLMKFFHIATDEDDVDALVKEEAITTPATPTKKTAQKKAPAAPAVKYTPVDEDTYWKYVAGEAEGKKCRSGKTYKQGWIDTTHAGAVEIAAFDADVDDVKHAREQ